MERRKKVRETELELLKRLKKEKRILKKMKQVESVE